MRRNTGAGDIVSVATAFQHNAQMCVFDNIAGYSGVSNNLQYKPYKKSRLFITCLDL